MSTTRRPDLVVLVIGESSALGVPYERWLSVGHVVVWQLQRVFPDRRCRLVMKAKPGATAAQMHAELADLDIRPDVVLIYCGHNEYFSRFPWSRAVPHYLDESPPQSLAERFDRLGRQTFLGLAAMKAIERQQVSEPPPRWVTRSLVDVPAFTYAESQEVVADYARRLRMIVAYCARIGAVPVLLVPAGNDGAFEPNRSVLPPQTSCSERAAFARGFMQARRAEAENPAQSETFFLALLRRAPSFAETHFRLARLRARAGDWPAAREHFAMARDLDGMPQRCTSALQRACRKAGEGPDCILVDGPRVLETLVPDKILDDRLFHDAHHPTLLGYVALAQDVLNQLQSRRALDWPDGMNAPRIDPMECAAQFGLGVRQWAAVCLHGRLWYRDEAYVRYDPRARLEQSRRLGAAMLRLVAGTAPEQSGIPGLGCQPDLSRPQLGPDGLTTD